MKKKGVERGSGMCIYIWSFGVFFFGGVIEGVYITVKTEEYDREFSL